MKASNGKVDVAIQELIPATSKNARPGIKMVAEYITIHNTGNPGASAKANSNYVRKQNGFKSWHFTIDDKYIIQQLPINEIGWHAGDGAAGPGNKKVYWYRDLRSSRGRRRKRLSLLRNY